MDARELTKMFYQSQDRIIELEKQVSFLMQELEKQRVLMSDLQIDVKMLERR